MKNPASSLPKARNKDLEVLELRDEVLVYDLARHRAYCLNPAAARIWELCDGEKAVSEISKQLDCDLGPNLSEEAVRFGLARLGKAQLLEAQVAVPEAGWSRREALRRIGAVAAVPLVISIVAPTWAQAATCLPNGTMGCTANSQCCNNMCMTGAGSMCDN